MADKLAISEVVQVRLDALARSLAGLCGDNLVALVVHGSAVRGEWHDGSDVDLVCVLADDAHGVLAAIGPALELARFSARIEAMILRKDEIERSADCFPLLYQDIARTGVTLAGTNPFAGLAIPDHHIRLRIEQELREIRIRMRRVATDRGPRHGSASKLALAGAVERKLKQARGPLRALLARRGADAPDTLDAVLAAACQRFAIDIAPLRRVREDPEPAYTTLGALLDAALTEIDKEES